MHSLRRIFACSLVLMVAARAAGQPVLRPPQPLELNLTQAAELTPQQVAQIETFVKYWGGILANPSSSPADVEKARLELVRPTHRLISPTFRYEYSRLLKPFADQALGSEGMHTAVNAVLVLANLGSEAAMRELLTRADSRNEARWQVRLHAARGARQLLEANTLPVNRIEEAGRRLKDAAIREDQALILRHQFDAINAVDTPSLIEPGARERVRALLVEAVSGVVDRIAGDDDPGRTALIEPVNDAVILLRNKLIGGAAVPASEQRGLASRLGPLLGRLLQTLVQRWDAGHEDKATTETFGVVIGTIEGFLPYIDALVRGAGNPSPQSKLREAWLGGEQQKFSTDTSAWQAVVTKAPYVSDRTAPTPPGP